MTNYSGHFAKQYKLYIDEIYRFVFFAVRLHRETAEDLTNMIFLKAWQALENFDPSRASFRTYLYKIAHNTVVDYYRAQQRTLVLELAENVPAEQVDPMQNLDAEMLWQQAAQLLDADALQMLVLKYRNDLLYEYTHIH